jgi:2'-5' RNA ligase
MLRLFIGVALPDEVRASLSALCTGVQAARWVAPEQLHVTLRFLGWTREEEVAALQSALGRVSAPAFGLSLKGVGAFPSAAERKPTRVLWAGVTPVAPLTAVKAAIDEALGPDPEPRDFHPHVTLARFKERAGPSLAEFLDRHAALGSAPWPVTSFHLYRSRMQRLGSVYTIEGTYPLTPL